MAESRRRMVSTLAMVDVAAKIYAEEGFAVPLSRIARAARVPVADLRRRVGAKAALRERVYERQFTGRWKPEWEALLVDRRIPLARRLERFYVEYRGNITRANARLWNWAGLAGYHRSGNFSATLAKRILHPVALELRHDAGVRSTRPVSRAEEELVQVLHGAIAFPHVRSHIYGMDVHGSLAQLVPMMVRVWLPGAKAEVRRMHRKPSRR